MVIIIVIIYFTSTITYHTEPGVQPLTIILIHEQFTKKVYAKLNFML